MAKRARRHVPGGYRQQAIWATSQASSSIGSSVGSALVQLLLLRWAWGDIYTPILQLICMAAFQDGLRHRDIEMLSKLGS